MINLNQALRTSLLAALGLNVLAACTTFGHKGNADDDGLAAGAAKESVVIQTGAQGPIVANHDRAYYLDLRKQKNVMARLNGSLATGETEAAMSLARAQLARHPGDPEALTMLAAGLALTRNYDLAAYYAGQLEQAQPGNPVALNIKGLAVMLSTKARLTDYRLAETYFQQAMSADGGQIAPGLNLGNLQLELGNPAGAAETFTAVVDRCGRCTAALVGQGVAYSRSRDYAKALTAFNEVLKKNPQHAGALYNLALVYKNGYHDNKQAEKYLFALLNESRTKNVAMREKAQVVLRMVKGEATPKERGQIADEAPAKDDGSDAELLMTGTEKDDE